MVTNHAFENYWFRILLKISFYPALQDRKTLTMRSARKSTSVIKVLVENRL